MPKFSKEKLKCSNSHLNVQGGGVGVILFFKGLSDLKAESLNQQRQQQQQQNHLFP